MLAGEFQRKLRQLNRELRVFCGDNDRLPASVFVIKNSEFEQICSCDKHYVPEHTEFDDQGFIKKAGWRRVLRILIQHRFIDRRRAERVFLTHLPYAPRNKVRAPKFAPSRKLMDKYMLPEEEVKWLSKIRG